MMKIHDKQFVNANRYYLPTNIEHNPIENHNE